MLKHQLPTHPIRGTQMSAQVVDHLTSWGLWRLNRYAADGTPPPSREDLAAEMVEHIEQDLDPSLLTYDRTVGKEREACLCWFDLHEQVAPWAAKRCFENWRPDWHASEERMTASQMGKRSGEARRERTPYPHGIVHGRMDVSARVLAEEFGCHRNTVYRLKREHQAWLDEQAKIVKPVPPASAEPFDLDAFLGVI